MLRRIREGRVLGYAIATITVNDGSLLLRFEWVLILFGVFLAFTYAKLMGGLWVMGGGPLAGMEFAAVLWLPIAFQTTGGAVWYTKVKRLFDATCWAWLARAARPTC